MMLLLMSHLPWIKLFLMSSPTWMTHRKTVLRNRDKNQEPSRLPNSLDGFLHYLCCATLQSICDVTVDVSSVMDNQTALCSRDDNPVFTTSKMTHFLAVDIGISPLLRNSAGRLWMMLLLMSHLK